MDWIHSPHFASFLLLLFLRLLNEVSERASAHIFATQTSCLNEKWINKNTVFSCIHGVVIIAVSGVFVGKWRRQRQPHWVKKNWSNWLTVFSPSAPIILCCFHLSKLPCSYINGGERVTKRADERVRSTRLCVCWQSYSHTHISTYIQRVTKIYTCTHSANTFIPRTHAYVCSFYILFSFDEHKVQLDSTQDFVCVSKFLCAIWSPIEKLYWLRLKNEWGDILPFTHDLLLSFFLSIQLCCRCFLRFFYFCLDNKWLWFRADELLLQSIRG